MRCETSALQGYTRPGTGVPSARVLGFPGAMPAPGLRKGKKRRGTELGRCREWGRRLSLVPRVPRRRQSCSTLQFPCVEGSAPALGNPQPGGQKNLSPAPGCSSPEGTQDRLSALVFGACVGGTDNHLLPGLSLFSPWGLGQVSETSFQFLGGGGHRVEHGSTESHFWGPRVTGRTSCTRRLPTSALTTRSLGPGEVGLQDIREPFIPHPPNPRVPEDPYWVRAYVSSC